MKKNIFIFILFSLITTAYAHHIDKRINTFVIVYDEDWAPYSYKDKKGVIKGILPDLFEELLHNKLDIPIKKEAFPAKRAYDFVEDGIYDGFILKYKTIKNNPSFLISNNSLFNIQIIPFVAKNSKKINQTNPISEKNNIFCNLLSDEMTNEIFISENITAHKSKNLKSAITMLKTSRTDFFVGEKISTLNYLYNNSLENKILMHPKIIAEIPIKLIVNNRSKLNRVSFIRLDNLITKMKKDGSYFKLIRKIQKRHINLH